MKRLDELRRFVDKSVLGMEVAAYFNPIVRKADGYPVMIVDVFDTDTLRRLAKQDPNIPDHRIAEIEEVDIVSDACGIGDAVTQRGLAGQFGYIVSSHNFEHLPDPVRFLQGCAVALRPGGTLSMAIPDYRACFDRYRMPTRLADWLAAYHRGVRQPSPETCFDFASNFDPPEPQDGAPAEALTQEGKPGNPLRVAYDQYLADLLDPGPYRDTHCSVMFGASFELMVRDLIHLGLVNLEVMSVTPTRGIEFFVHLRKPVQTLPPTDDARFTAERQNLLRRVSAGLGNGANHAPLSRRAEMFAKGGLRILLGKDTANALRQWNRKRRNRRRNGV